jgi:glycosyltransferase involved in cell wall biosynthesis
MLLLHAFRELAQADNAYRLFIGGNFQDARYKLYFGQMIKEMGLQKNIQVDGWIEDVGTWLEDKHYIVCSSVLEGHPVGLMEAMACGLKPVIHNFVGAKGVYPTKYLWNIIPEFVQKVTHENYDSSEYRRFVQTNYSLDIQLNRIDSILSKSKKVKQIPIMGNINMVAETTENADNNVTAIIAVRNGSTTIKKTLDSLLSQTVPLKKIIVVDDCSSDETPKLVEDYAAKSDGKIELLKLPYNHWVYKARNAAFKKIDTELFFFLDADDFVEPTYTERLITVLRENPDCAFAYSDMIHFNESGQAPTSLPDFDVTTLMKRNYIPYSALMRNSDFMSVGGYSNYLNDCRNHMTEWDLWLRFVAAGKAGKRYPKPMFNYYQDADQMSKNYERTRSDMQLQMALNRGASVTLNCGNGSRTLLVCQGRDYLDRSKVGFEVYTWLKPLATFGEVFTFFYDIESQYFGQDGMIKRLFSFIDQIQPSYIFHPAYKEHISIDCWKTISKRFVTMVWFSDDNWRFASYSKRYCHGFGFAITTYPEVYEQYKAMDYRTILLSQWAANTEYFRDYGLPKDIDVSFCGQRYGDRDELLEGSGVQCFGKGWPNGLLDFPESNTLLLCEKTDELNKYYKIGEEVIIFENKEDLRQKIDYYLQHEEERGQIARAAYERTMKEHTWSNRFDKIIKAVDGEVM